MSYDIAFKVKVEGSDFYVKVGDCDANTTWNVREMIVKSTGLPWRNTENNGLCKDVIPFIAQGYRELTQYPEKYKQYEASNGWGTVESTTGFFKQILESWERLCKYEPEFVELATFWIE